MLTTTLQKIECVFLRSVKVKLQPIKTLSLDFTIFPCIFKTKLSTLKIN